MNDTINNKKKKKNYLKKMQWKQLASDELCVRTANERTNHAVHLYNLTFTANAFEFLVHVKTVYSGLGLQVVSESDILKAILQDRRVK